MVGLKRTLALLFIGVYLAGCSLGGPALDVPLGPVEPDLEQVEATLESMTLQQKIGQLILAGFEGDQMTPETCQYLQQVMPGGVTFQHGNLQTPEQARALIQDVEECIGAVQPVPLLLSVAHEGETINRFLSGATSFPTALALGATGDPTEAYQTSKAASAELAYSGFNMVLGPVADVLLNPDSVVLSDRTFGGQTYQVDLFVEQAVKGYLEGGLIPAVKHFPGHGGVAEDSHEVLPIDNAGRSELEEDYLPPFRIALQAGAPVVMLSHVAYPAISGAEEPATLSPKIIELLRKDLGFRGVILSDSMRMKAVTPEKVGVHRTSLQAIQTGVDMVLLNWQGHAIATHEYLVDAVLEEKLSEERVDEAVRRILILKASWGLQPYAYLDTPPPDWQANAELAERAGERAVTVIKDVESWIPIPTELKRILVLAPDSTWDLLAELRQKMEQRGHSVEFVTYPPPWNGPVQDQELLDRLPQLAAGHDLVIAFTWEAHLNRLENGDTWQTTAVNSLNASGVPLVVIAINSPTDILEFPQVPAFVAMFGSTAGQERALVGALTGEWTPQGYNPLPSIYP